MRAHAILKEPNFQVTSEFWLSMMWRLFLLKEVLNLCFLVVVVWLVVESSFWRWLSLQPISLSWLKAAGCGIDWPNHLLVAACWNGCCSCSLCSCWPLRWLDCRWASCSSQVLRSIIYRRACFPGRPASCRNAIYWPSIFVYHSASASYQVPTAPTPLSSASS